MHLEYAEYINMGGNLDEEVYIPLERKARYLINSQAGGRCGDRIADLEEIPDCIKDCVFDLVSFLAVNNSTDKQIASESQSQGGASEGLTYVTRTDAEIAAQGEGIIHDYLYGGGYGHLLYKGACL